MAKLKDDPWSEYSSCADAIGKALYSAGVRYVFGYPGGEVISLIDALVTNGIEFILTGHEATAAFMAASTGRLTSFPGICLSTLGPGACNLVVGVGCAYLDRDPMIALSATTASNQCATHNKQNLPLEDLFSHITKWSITVNGAKTSETIHSAIDVAITPKSGPIYLGVPSDIATSREKLDAQPPPPPNIAPFDDSSFEKILLALNSARWPVGIIGLALDPEEDVKPVRDFFAHTGIPYAVLPQGKGIADEGGDMFLGTIASSAGDVQIAEWIQRSDCLLGIGFDPVECASDWHLNRPLYSIANAPVGYGSFQPTLECTGAVSELVKNLQSGYSGNAAWSKNDVKQLQTQISKLITPSVSSTSAGLSPYHLVHAVRDILPSDSILTTGVGVHKMVVCQEWRTPKPKTLVVSNGLSAMGFGFSATLSASLLYP